MSTSGSNRPRSRAAHGARVRIITCALATMAALSVSDAYAQRARPTEGNVIPIQITSVTVQDGQLVASGAVGSNQFTTPISLGLSPEQTGVGCPILDLQLGPIHLDLLGLNVDTSAICLDITARPGEGLLGDLLCGIANLLTQGVPLGTILQGLTAPQLSTLDAGLTSLLNQAVFDRLTRTTAVADATCEILSLTLGPLDLTLLGLNVRLDNCAGGPITLDITADPGGGLLGDLLCDLANLLDGRPNRTAILAVLREIARVIGGIVG